MDYKHITFNNLSGTENDFLITFEFNPTLSEIVVFKDGIEMSKDDYSFVSLNNTLHFTDPPICTKLLIMRDTDVSSSVAMLSSKKSPEYVAAFLSKARPYGNKLAQENLQAHIAADKKSFIDNTTAIVRKSLNLVDTSLPANERVKKVQQNLKELKKRISEGGYTEYDYKAAE